MQTPWFSSRSAEQSFIQKALLHSWYISVSLTQWPSCQCEHLAPQRVHRIQNTLGLDQNPDIRMDGRMSPLQIFAPLIKATGDPYWGGQVSSVRREENGCLRTACQSASQLTGHWMGSVRHGAARGQGEITETTTLSRYLHSLLQCLLHVMLSVCGIISPSTLKYQRNKNPALICFLVTSLPLS